YLLLLVEDPDVVYHNPGRSPEPNGDRLVLTTWRDNSRQLYVVSTAAPGRVRALRGPGQASRDAPVNGELDPAGIRGYWQDSRKGYSLELEIPLDFIGDHLGFYIVNESSSSAIATSSLGNASPRNRSAPPWLIYSPPALRQVISPFVEPGGHFQIVDRAGWVIADASEPPAAPVQATTDQTFWLLRLFYRSILKQDALEPVQTGAPAGRPERGEITAALGGTVASLWYHDPDNSARTTLSSASPVYHQGNVVGAVVAHQSSEQYLPLTDQAFSRLLRYSLAGIGIAALGLFGYASALSWRIRHLSQAASSIISDDGILLDTFPRSTAGDEIGELSRRYADLLDRLREYTDYLRSLSRKLSHELRTPIAVIQTSLENLEQQSEQSEMQSTYIARAREGLSRLSKILTAMSEASALEESIHNNPSRELDLVPLVQEIFGAYQGIYSDHQLVFECDAQRALVNATPDLVVQALDKLMDNAASFCPTGGLISLELKPSEEKWMLSVSNEGPLLPEQMQDSLFDSMVSLRESRSDKVHLGLGLHIVRLISEFHGGSIHAANLPDQTGVRFTMVIPGCS
ncbi:MAG: hypothetical protein HOC23_20285, partial [Halieaceae bacterium]|nr:hypothetical protein [Halieaceae bacterium]